MWTEGHQQDFFLGNTLWIGTQIGDNLLWSRWRQVLSQLSLLSPKCVRMEKSLSQSYCTLEAFNSISCLLVALEMHQDVSEAGRASFQYVLAHMPKVTCHIFRRFWLEQIRLHFHLDAHFRTDLADYQIVKLRWPTWIASFGRRSGEFIPISEVEAGLFETYLFTWELIQF